MFEDAQAAAMAVSQLNGTSPFQDQNLIVRIARDKASIGAPNQGTNVWVGNLPLEYGEDDVRSFMATYGTITSLKLLQKPGSAAAAAMVNFSTPQEASSAVSSLEGQMLPTSTQPLTIRFAVPKGGKGAGKGGFMMGGFSPMQMMYSGRGMMGPQSWGMGGGAGALTNIWVGNLPQTWTPADVQALFASYGNITATKLLNNKQGSQPTRAAMVNFSSPHEASMAIQSLNGTVLPDNGLPLIVKHATKDLGAGPPQGFSNGYGAAAFSAPQGPPTDNLWVGNLPAYFTESELSGLFSQYGRVASCVILRRPGTPVAGMVQFASVQEASMALNALNNAAIDPSMPPLHVKFSRSKGGAAAPAGPAAWPPAMPMARGGAMKGGGMKGGPRFHPYGGYQGY